ncbi:MAG: response regulator [Cyanothece sp. SIO1E1]|nr:response regulator [Cyanothece sp. SIO1E1]
MNIPSQAAPTADILIVDDTPDNIRLLASMLLKQGYKVRKALNGQRALQAVSVDAPDLILLDIMMPDMKGYEVCQRLKESEPTRDIPVIFISALDDVFDKVLAFDVGGADYVTKPFRVQEVLARIQHQLIIRQQQKQLQAQNQQLQEEIRARQKAEADLRVYFHAVSHDLRNPVIGMSMVCKKLLQRAQQQETRYAAPAASTLKTQNVASPSLSPTIPIPIAFLKRMDGSCDRQLSLINSLVESSQLEVWGVRLQCQPLQLQNLAQQLADEWELRLNQHESTLSQHIPPDLPPVYVDANQLWRVFENLIANALKYNAQGLNLVLAAEVVEREGEQKQGKQGEHRKQGERGEQQVSDFTASLMPHSYSHMVLCTVGDDGVGMAPEQGAGLFDLYRRGESARSTKGLGLGLYLCRQIIEAHGGKIGVITSPNHGATFRFTLPIYVTE